MFPFVLLQSFKGGSARNRRPPLGRLSAKVSAGMDRKVLIYSATEHLDDMPVGDKDDAEESHWAWGFGLPNRLPNHVTDQGDPLQMYDVVDHVLKTPVL